MADGHVSAAAASRTDLQARLYALPSRAVTAEHVTILALPFHCVGSARHDIPSSLRSILHKEFNEELERGVTYPQRAPMSVQDFETYFLSYDLIVGALLNDEQTSNLLSANGAKIRNEDIPQVGLELKISKELASEIDWCQAYGFSYYIKPNYPGRSSHLCNAGFVVPLSARNLGLGGIAAISFLHYGPACGYRGSIFNLVYANNEASVRIWDRLGFTRVGRIPQAGLLRTADGTGEEFVDAWVIHGDFEKLGSQGIPKEAAKTVLP